MTNLDLLRTAEDLSSQDRALACTDTVSSSLVLEKRLCRVNDGLLLWCPFQSKSCGCLSSIVSEGLQGWIRVTSLTSLIWQLIPEFGEVPP